MKKQPQNPESKRTYEQDRRLSLSSRKRSQSRYPPCFDCAKSVKTSLPSIQPGSTDSEHPATIQLVFVKLPRDHRIRTPYTSLALSRSFQLPNIGKDGRDPAGRISTVLMSNSLRLAKCRKRRPRHTTKVLVRGRIFSFAFSASATEQQQSLMVTSCYAEIHSNYFHSF